ncbi:unnamed protein product [Mytilus edulis]|uniref:Endonuclease/exonuclease/phosphatase domain-containing protein n=1 Tax=Mytilus edulis TaxID=6550 RepID=A0A8S3QIC9_MYTED|nr:unnamed protein product [Mytilus edulis]
MDLLTSINFFQVDSATYLSDHSQISVHIYCNITPDFEEDSPNFIPLQCTYKWEAISKNKLIDTISDCDVLHEIVSFENNIFDENSNGINKASEQLTNIFDNLAKTSCKIIRHKKVKIKKKKSWSDNEVKDLKKTVVDLGNKMRSKPFDMQLRHDGKFKSTFSVPGET